MQEHQHRPGTVTVAQALGLNPDALPQGNRKIADVHAVTAAPESRR